MGIMAWIVEEIADLFTGDADGTAAGAGVDGIISGAGSGGFDFVDPLEQGRQVIENDPVLSGVQDTMAKASAMYKDTMGTDHVPSPVESGQQFISTVMSASPEQLNRMGLQLEGMNAEAGIRRSVADFQDELREKNARHQAIMDADAAKIEADGISADAAYLIWRTNRLLGTSY